MFFKDGDRMNLTPDRDQVRTTFESYEQGGDETFDAYLNRSKRTYEAAMERFV